MQMHQVVERHDGAQRGKKREGEQAEALAQPHAPLVILENL